MRQFLSRPMIRMILPFIVIMAVTLGCAIPFLPGNTTAPTATGSAPQGTPATPSSEGAAPSTVLTQAAATLYAPLQATWTAQAGQPVNPGAATPAAPAQQPAATQPPAQQPATQAPAQSSAATQPPAAQPAATQPSLIQPIQPGQQGQAPQQPIQQQPQQPAATPLPLIHPIQPGQQQGQAPQQPQQPAPTPLPLIHPIQPGQQQPAQPPQQPTAAPQQPAILPTANVPPTSQTFMKFPLAGFFVQDARSFHVLGVNLPVCGGVYSANFLIANTGTAPLESISFQVTNSANNAVLFGPVTNNAPFMSSDTTCTPGGTPALAPGAGLFVGGSLGAANLSGQTVRVDIRLCTQDNLGGQCETVPVEFVVP